MISKEVLFASCVFALYLAAVMAADSSTAVPSMTDSTTAAGSGKNGTDVSGSGVNLLYSAAVMTLSAAFSMLF